MKAPTYLKRRFITFAAAIISGLILLAINIYIYPQNISQKNIKGQFFVKRVIDGDTIELSNGQKVRYIGIDTPEKKHGKRLEECFAKEAFEKNKQLVLNKNVILVKDISETDRYGRLLRYVYIDGIFVNEYLVVHGYAFAASFPPDIAHQADFSTAQNQARKNEVGLWNEKNCPTNPN